MIQQLLEEYGATFQAFDLNNDGRITETELGKALSDEGRHYSPTQLKNTIKQGDSNGTPFLLIFVIDNIDESNLGPFTHEVFYFYFRPTKDVINLRADKRHV